MFALLIGGFRDEDTGPRAISAIAIELAAALAFATSTPATSNVDQTVLPGKWTYRSFHNNPSEVAGDPDKAIKLIFAEAIFTFEVDANSSVKGAIDWQGGGLDLTGIVEPPSANAPLAVHITGTGRSGTATAGWEYDYVGYLAPQWPAGVNQIPALVGTVMRAKPHGSAPVGYVASFIAVKHI